MACFNEYTGTWQGTDANGPKEEETEEIPEEITGEHAKEEVEDDHENESGWEAWKAWAIEGPTYDDTPADATPGDAAEPAAAADGAAADGPGAAAGAAPEKGSGGGSRTTPPWRQPWKGRGKGRGKHNKWKGHGQGHAHGGRGRNDKPTTWGKGWKRPWDHAAEWHDGASSSTSTCLVFYFLSICLPTI